VLPWLDNLKGIVRMNTVFFIIAYGLLIPQERLGGDLFKTVGWIISLNSAILNVGGDAMDTKENLTGVGNLDQISELYRHAKNDQIALLLGSGVNGGLWAKQYPACASWPELLRALDKHFHTKPRLSDDLINSNADWISVAAKLLEDKDRQEIIQAIDLAIYPGVFRNPALRTKTSRKHKVLSWTVLKKMATLSASVCFSAAIQEPTRARSMCRNPKVGRVLTTNYDFFFSAAWPRYTSMRKSWWPATWSSSGSLLEGAGPIIYLHGYLPYTGEGARDVVLTQEDYNRAYTLTDDGDGRFSWQQLTDAVECCHLIFIGFSFSDFRVGEAIRQADSTNQHFAFLLKSESRQIQAAEDIGVMPITLDSWAQLPLALEYIYCQGLTKEELQEKGLNKSQYWEKLQKGLEPRKKKKT